MNHRERALKALCHQEPDRVPIDLDSTIVTSMTRTTYKCLRGYLGMSPDEQVKISHRQIDTVYPNEDIFQGYDVDFRPVYLQGPWLFKSCELPDDSFYDEYNLKWKKASYYYDVVERPLAKIETIQELNYVQWPNPYDMGRVAGISAEAKRLYEDTDYSIVADIMCLGPLEGECFLRGYDNFCIDLYWNSELAIAILEKIVETDITLWDLFLQHVGPHIQVVAHGDDLGTQRGTWTSPEMNRKFIKPYHQKMYDFIKSKTNAKIFMHSCGSVYDLIPDLIEVGVNILNPVQRSAAKMKINALKSEFGKDLTFWGGGIDVQQVLPFATLQEIGDEVKQTIDIMAPGGGFIFCPSYSIQADVTPDRIHKLYETALHYATVITASLN